MDIETTARYDIELLTPGHDLQQLEQLLHRVRGLTVSPQEIIASCPCTIAINVSGNASLKLQAYLDQLGATITLRKHTLEPLSASPPLPAVSDELEPSEHVRDSEVSATMPVPANGTRNSTPDNLPYQPASHDVVPSQSAVTPAITLKRSVGELTRALQDKDWTVREHAVIELGRVPSDGIMKHLVASLKDDVWRVRCTALHVLSQAGSDTVLRDIAKCIEDDVWHVRYHAVKALGQIESDKIIKPLLSAVNDTNWQVRQQAVKVLGRLQTRRALNGLTTCLKDEVWYVRVRAAEALAKLKSEKAAHALIAALHDPNWRVRSMVVSALKEIGTEDAVEALVHVLNDEHWMLHWKAAYTFSHIGNPDILPILCRFDKENRPLLGEAARCVLRSLDVVVETHPNARLRLAYRSEDPYANMRYIPAGEFLMGDEQGHGDAKPAQPIFLPEFFVDNYEVTNAQYKLFDPSHHYPEGQDWYPVVNVTWAEAQAYAAWLGKRLPTEVEWEKSARGADGYLYPWGHEFDSAKCNTEESGNRGLTPVNQYPSGGSPFQVYDLFGNVLEWTSDRYQAYPGSLYESPDFQEGFVVLRGSPWIHQGSQANCATRSYAPAENRSNFIGFRCVKDVE